MRERRQIDQQPKKTLNTERGTKSKKAYKALKQQSKRSLETFGRLEDYDFDQEIPEREPNDPPKANAWFDLEWSEDGNSWSLSAEALARKLG